MNDFVTQALIYLGLGLSCFFAGYYFHSDFIIGKRGSNATS